MALAPGRRRLMGLATPADVVERMPRAEVDVALVLAVDSSGSISEQRLNMQIEGYLDALRHPSFIEAVQGGPVQASRNDIGSVERWMRLLVSHLEEQEVGDLLYVVTVVDTLVSQHMTERPQLVCDRCHAATASLRAASVWPSCPSNTLSARGQPPCLEKMGTT